MQSAKDSFYIALRGRLAALNPQRAVFLDGATRPAIVVCENEPLTSAAPPLSALTLHARLTALPFTDANDSEPALCWRTYYPAVGASLF